AVCPWRLAMGRISLVSLLHPQTIADLVRSRTMQEFTRSLTREIQVDGERLAVTLDKEGLSIRPVGSRRPPSSLSWAACLCAAVGNPPDAAAELVAAALTTLK